MSWRRSCSLRSQLSCGLELPSCFSSSDLDRTATPTIAQMHMGSRLYGSQQIARTYYPETAVIPSIDVRETTIGDVQKLFEQTIKRGDTLC